MAVRLLAKTAMLTALAATTPATGAWKAGNADVMAAIADVSVAGALAAMDKIDLAAVSGDHAAFAGMLADDLAVNNPQNGLSVRGATGRRSNAGQISYASYNRTIEYVGRRSDMVLVMGEEIVLPKTPDGAGALPVHRRFTDLWKQVAGEWKLTARQATIITPHE